MKYGQCPVFACSLTVNATKFLMCSRHWRLVPAELQPKVYAAFRAFERNDINLKALQAVQQQAIDAVNKVVAA